MTTRALTQKKSARGVLNTAINQVDGGASHGSQTDGENRPMINDLQPGQDKHIKTDIAAELGICHVERNPIDK